MEVFCKAISGEFSGKDFISTDIMGMKEMPKLTKKPTKAKKDPNAPKKSTTAYFYYMADVRSTVKEENPGMKSSELSKIMGKMWNGLTKHQQLKYIQMAETDKGRYAKEMESYNMSKGSDSDSEKSGESDKEEVHKIKKIKKIKDPNAPKRNLSSLQFYSANIRQQHTNVKYTQKVLKTMWDELDDTSEFDDMAATDKIRYKTEKEEYEATK
jgi:structure-specific recognition protein 1